MKILFVGGGTLGSVTPLLAVAEEIKKSNPDVQLEWVGTRRGVERAVVAARGIPYHWVVATKLRRYFDIRTLFLPFILIAGFKQSCWLMLVLRPTVVVVSGAFVQVPVVWAAQLFGVPVVLHQQDVLVGLANRISLRSSSVNTAAFAVSVKEFKNKKVEVIGNPVRNVVGQLADPAVRERFKVAGRSRWGFDVSKPTLLIMGGGTGAVTLNEQVWRVLDELLKYANVIHSTGKGKMEKIASRQGYVAVELLDDTTGAEAYALTDVSLTRAGLGTITELCALGIASVLVPLVGHQEKNAALMGNAGAALVLAPGSSDQQFVDTVHMLLMDRDRRLQLGRAAEVFLPADAGAKLAKIILTTVHAHTHRK